MPTMPPAAPGGIDEGAIIGKGARFSGAGAITVPASPSLAITAGGAFTFSAWVKNAAPQAARGLYVRRDGAASLIIGLDQGVPFVEIQAGRAASHRDASRSRKRVDPHVAVTADGKA